MSFPVNPSTRRWCLAGLLLTTLGVAGPATAHGPTRQKVTEQVLIDASVEKVWAVVGAFDGLKNWHPAVAESAADKGNEIGSLRNVKLKTGGELLETLETYDAGAMRLGYRAKNGGALPVTNYTSQLSVKAEGGKTLVEWRGAFYRGFPNNDPPPDQNDEAALRAVTAVYKEGLAGLKRVLEAK